MNERELRVLRALINNLRAIYQEIRTIGDEQRAQHDTTNSDPVQPLQVEILATPQLDPARQEYYQAENRERHAFWNKIKPWVEGTGVLVGLALLGLNLATLNQVKRQADVAETDNRPWLKIVDVTLDDSIPDEPILSFSPAPTVKPMTAAYMRTEFRIKNIGKGVAQNISIEPDIVFEPWTARSATDVIDDAEHRSCEFVLKQNPRPRAFTWSAIFPGDEVRHRIVIGKPFDTDAVSHIPNRAGNWLSGAVIGCVTYQYPRKYQTRAVFHIMGPRDRFVEVGKNLDISNLHLLRNEHYEYAQ